MDSTNPQTRHAPDTSARILCVDDEDAIRESLGRALSCRGHLVRVAANAEQALGYLDREEFDLAILDVGLPRTDGIELLGKIKRRSPRIEAVMLSGYGSIETAMRSVHAGAFDFIEKPYRLERLFHTVERALEHQRLQQTTALYHAQVLLAVENSRRTRQAAMSEKLLAVGQLAAGIAHEVNTPMQFLSDSLSFVQEAFSDIGVLIDRYAELARAIPDLEVPEALRSLACQAQAQSDHMDVAYLRDAVPKAIGRCNEGIGRVIEIVRAVKDFGRPDCRENLPVDLNECLRSTLTVCRSEYKRVADAVTDFAELPPVVCHPGELNQVFLSIIVNAGHAIADAVVGTERRGRILVKTRLVDREAVVSVEDTGTGIPEHVQARMFEPFFTTKEVGRGAGLGLSVARTIVENHGGKLTFETEIGRGSTFAIRLPVLG
jgi:signal transduction histidine kinase